MVNQLFIASDATNSFKLKMSLAFSMLVGVVIVGFFIIAWSNEEIKKTIFSNESGIQFITMFAIVIAVILFGIIGVLESKELSAILGGLSGYILGKSRAYEVINRTITNLMNLIVRVAEVYSIIAFSVVIFRV